MFNCFNSCKLGQKTWRVKKKIIEGEQPPPSKKPYTHKKFRLFYQHTSITVQCTFTYCLSHGWLPYKFLIPLTIIQIVHDHQDVFKNKLLVSSWTRSLNSNNIQFNCIMFIPLKQRISIEHNLKDTLHKFLVVYSDCTLHRSIHKWAGRWINWFLTIAVYDIFIKPTFTWTLVPSYLLKAFTYFYVLLSPGHSLNLHRCKSQSVSRGHKDSTKKYTHVREPVHVENKRPMGHTAHLNSNKLVQQHDDS